VARIYKETGIPEKRSTFFISQFEHNFSVI